MSKMLHAIMHVGDCGPEEAKEIQQELAQAVLDGEDPEEVLRDAGLEPDYVIDLIDLLYEEPV